MIISLLFFMSGNFQAVAKEENFSSILAAPVDSALMRVTKKPFGIMVSAQNSPVQPERFSGYHTGVDFEILPGGEDKEIPVSAICTGTLLYKNQVEGYGGTVVQKCKINGQDATVLYGHLDLLSVSSRAGDAIRAGDKIAVLGKGYSQETDGERKHLHLGIHKGYKMDLRGYVNTSEELNEWRDATKYIAPWSQ